MTLPDVREVVKSLLEEQRTTEDVGLPAMHATCTVQVSLACGPEEKCSSPIFCRSRSLSRINANGKLWCFFFKNKNKRIVGTADVARAENFSLVRAPCFRHAHVGASPFLPMNFVSFFVS